MVGLPKTDWWRHWWWWCWCWKGKTRQKARLASHLGLPRTDLKLPGRREHNTEYRWSSHPPISHSAMIISIIPFCKCCTCSRYPTPHKHTHTHQILQMFSLICFLKTGWVTCFTIQVLSSAHPILSFCDCFTLFACLKHLLHNLFRPIRWSRSAII